MLTQIEWWGGVIFVLGALTYRMVMGALERPVDGFPWYRLMMHVFFLAPAALLAGYFYPLTQPALQYGYLALLAVSLLLGFWIPSGLQAGLEHAARLLGGGAP